MHYCGRLLCYLRFKFPYIIDDLFIIQRYTKFFHPCVEGLGGDLKLFCGTAFIAVVVPESLFYFTLLVGIIVDGINHGVHDYGVFRYSLARTNEYGVFDDIKQFSNVARPDMSANHL